LRDARGRSNSQAHPQASSNGVFAIEPALWRPQQESDVTEIERAAVDILSASRRLDAVLHDATAGEDEYKAASAEFEGAVAKMREAMARTTPPHHLARRFAEANVLIPPRRKDGP
jgi:hypothetical protein